MQRDGARLSLWQYKMPAYQSVVAAIPSDIMDVLIVGGGITGITTALLLQLAGKKCVLAEAKSLCFGTTGGTTAHINTVLDHPYNEIESKFGENNARLLANGTVQAVAFIREMVQRYKIDCGFKEQEGYLFAQDDKQEKELEKILLATQKTGIDMQDSATIPVPIPFQKAVVFRGQARFHPARYVYELAKVFEDAGGILLQGCTVASFEEKDVMEISTSYGKIKARHIIWATHIPPGVNLLHFRCAPYRSYAAALKLRSNKYPEGLVYDMHDPYHYYRSQEINGEQYLIAGGEDHKTAHEKSTNECFTRLETYVRKFFDVDSVAFKWSSQYFEPVDGLPYIGHLPGNPANVYVATGFGGNGMVYGTISALVLHDILVNGKSGYQELFDPNRLKPIAGFSNFVK